MCVIKKLTCDVSLFIYITAIVMVVSYSLRN